MNFFFRFFSSANINYAQISDGSLCFGSLWAFTPRDKKGDITQVCCAMLVAIYRLFLKSLHIKDSSLKQIMCYSLRDNILPLVLGKCLFLPQ